jgi:enterochelin esterase-like enzyme
MRRRVFLASTVGALAGVAAVRTPHAAQAAGNPESPGAARPAIALAADDIAAFPAPPAGFDTERTGIARGNVVEFSYASRVTGTRRKAQVYLPPGYSETQRYPVLYLLHGIGGNQDEWRGYVRAHIVLDNLLADRAAVPMIVVMPNGRALADDRVPPAEQTFTPEHIAGFAQFERDLLESLVPAIDRTYPTLAERGKRAIAGLSMGGGQALNFGLAHLETFAWVGGFSSAPNTRAGEELLPDPAAAARRLRLLYLSCGKKDGLIGVSQAMHRYLRQHGVGHVWHVDAFAHARESWAENLYHFSKLLFR